MIPAIDPGIGLKEEGPPPRVPPTSGNPGFTQALKKASGHSQKAAERRPLQDARDPRDARARERYGKDSADAKRAVEKPSGKVAHKPASKAPQTSERDADGAARDSAAQEGGEGDLQAVAQQSGAVALQPAATAAVSLDDQAQDPTLAALALNNVEEPEHFATPEDATPISAQIGAAAYRLGQHGKGEAQLAQAAGMMPNDALQAQMLGRGVRDVTLNTLQKAEQSDLKAPVEGALAEEKDILQPTDPDKLKEAKGLSYKEQIALQSAQARNEVLSRLTAVGGEQGAAGMGLEGGRGDALRQHLQLQGMLARDARAHTLQPTAPTTNQTLPAGLVTPANSVDLRQVYETPQDDAVQQRVVDRVGNEARWLINSNRQEVTLRLSPEHLGNLHMKVEHEDGTFRVHLTVDNLAAKHLLESNLQDLRNRLMGDHPGGEFLFSVDVRQGNEQPSLHARAHRQAPGALGRSAALEQAPAPGLAGRVLGHSGLSIYV